MTLGPDLLPRNPCSDSRSPGIGLAMVHSTVEMHRGRGWAESNLRDGAKFSFILPIKVNS